MTEFVANTNEYAVESTPFEKKPAGFWIRFFAYLVDLILVKAVLVNLIVHNIFTLLKIENISILYIPIMSIVDGLVFYAYFVLMTKYFNQTLGKMIFGLKVVGDDGQALPWLKVLFREFVGRFLSVKIAILYLIVPFTKKHKAVHDFIADTHVIHERAYHLKSDNPTFAQSKSLKEVYNNKETSQS